MKKIVVFTLALILSASLGFSNLVTLYKKGTIKLTAADPNFGKGVDWESLFYDINKDIVVADDGTVFVSNNRQDNIFKFNASGKHIGTYGQKGEGKGDLRSPGNISILDGKYLIIGEYGLLRRISVFDFSGKCIKILKTNHNEGNTIALKNNRIAYIYDDTQYMEKLG
jgi:DNA-binding beta-propeller fold protein YncE